MKHSILILLLVTSSLSGEERALGFYSVISEDGRPTADAIFTIEAKADRTIWHDQDKNFDLGLGKVSDGARTPIDLKFPEIKSFLERERHKDLVVVWFDKTVMWNEQDFINTRTAEVIKQMKEVGYKRVVILGAHSSGVHYVADTSLKQPRAEQV